MGYETTVREWFKTGLKPTQAQFWAKYSFLRWKDEKISVADIEDIEEILNAKAETVVFTNHLTDTNAHYSEFEAKEDKNQKGVAGGYVPLDEFGRVSIAYLKYVNDLITGGEDSLLTAEQGKILQTQIDNLNTTLGKDKINILINKDDTYGVLEYEFMIVDFTDPNETEITFNQETNLKTLPLKVGRMYGLMLVSTNASGMCIFGNFQFDLDDANRNFGAIGKNIIRDYSYGNDTVIGYFSTDFMINIIMEKE